MNCSLSLSLPLYVVSSVLNLVSRSSSPPSPPPPWPKPWPNMHKSQSKTISRSLFATQLYSSVRFPLIKTELTFHTGLYRPSSRSPSRLRVRKQQRPPALNLKACKILKSDLICTHSAQLYWLITIFSAMTGLWLLQERNHADLFASSIFALIFVRCLRWSSESVPAKHNPSPSSDKPNLLGSVKVQIELVQSNWFGTFVSLCFHGVGTQVTWEAPSRQVC